MITTSNFRLSGRNPLAVAISNGTRGYHQVRKMKQLAPPWALVKSDCSHEYFRHEYMKQLAMLDPKQIVKGLGPNAIMLCWESPGEFCHRRITAEWLEGELGIVVPELVVEETRLKTKPLFP